MSESSESAENGSNSSIVEEALEDDEVAEDGIVNRQQHNGGGSEPTGADPDGTVDVAHPEAEAVPAEPENNESNSDRSEPAEADKVVERRSTGGSVAVDITRGTGTRDQEKWSLKGKGETAEAAIEELRTELEELIGPLDDEPVAAQVRAFDPEADNEQAK
jgi:hypothetical protein